LIASIHRSRRWKPYRFRVHDWLWNAPPSDPEPVRQILATLSIVQNRIGMFVGGPTADAFEHFLHGFELGCSLTGWKIDHSPESPYHTVLEAHGWTLSAMSPVQEMRDRGWNEPAIIDELLTIEKEAWCATYNLE
jgi:hypothetical protein